VNKRTSSTSWDAVLDWHQRDVSLSLHRPKAKCSFSPYSYMQPRSGFPLSWSLSRHVIWNVCGRSWTSDGTNPTHLLTHSVTCRHQSTVHSSTRSTAGQVVDAMPSSATFCRRYSCTVSSPTSNRRIFSVIGNVNLIAHGPRWLRGDYDYDNDDDNED